MAHELLEDKLTLFLKEDQPLTQVDEEAAALEAMRQDDTVHLTTPVLRLLGGREIPDLASVAEAIVPHLVRCAHCRLTLKQTLELIGATEQYHGANLLQHADRVVRWQAAAKTATDAAHKIGEESGSGYVYECNGVVYRQLEGREEIVSTEKCSL